MLAKKKALIASLFSLACPFTSGRIETNSQTLTFFGILSVWAVKCDSGLLSPPSFVCLVDMFECVSMVIKDATHEEL